MEQELDMTVDERRQMPEVIVALAKMILHPLTKETRHRIRSAIAGIERFDTIHSECLGVPTVGF